MEMLYVIPCVFKAAQQLLFSVPSSLVWVTSSILFVFIYFRIAKMIVQLYFLCFNLFQNFHGGQLIVSICLKFFKRVKMPYLSDIG